MVKQHAIHSPVDRVLPAFQVHVPEEEESTDRTGQQFANIPGMDSVFVLVGRNPEQWRASLGLQQGIMHQNNFNFNF